LIEYLSYSQYNTYTNCPRSWYLSKIRKAEEKQTWYIPVGSAVHNMIEDYLDPDVGPTLVTPERADTYFFPLIAKQRLIEPDTSRWLAGGPKASPVIEEKALQLVKDCFERALEELEDIDVWEVEYDASGRLPGLSVPLKAYVDLIGEHKKKGPVILDWKTGSTKPGNFQLETYAVLLAKPDHFWNLTDKRPLSFKGRYVMLAPGASSTRYVNLSEVSPEAVGMKYQAVYDQMQAKIYKANAGFNCRFCFNQENCLANAGPLPTKRAIYYDRSEKDGIPF